MTETDLIDRARRGEGDAVHALYNLYAPRVHAVIRRLAGDDALADDWAQETWVQAIRALPGFRGQSRFGTWIHRIAVNRALQGRRSRARNAGREEPLDPTYPARHLSDDALLKVRLERALDQLPVRMREVLVLHDVEGFTHEEIGVQLGIAPGTCKSQLFKARAKMREMLRPVAEPVGEIQ